MGQLFMVRVKRGQDLVGLRALRCFQDLRDRPKTLGLMLRSSFLCFSKADLAS